jgi:hypothetical protein
VVGLVYNITAYILSVSTGPPEYEYRFRHGNLTARDPVSTQHVRPVGHDLGSGDSSSTPQNQTTCVVCPQSVPPCPCSQGCTILLQTCENCSRAVCNKTESIPTGEAERIEAERLQKEEEERVEAERLRKEEEERVEAERLRKEKEERVEAERLQKEEGERVEAERLEAERIKAERLRKEEEDRVEAEKLEGTLASPSKTSSKMIVLVLSRRDAFDTRNVIRETWAKGHDNVYFLLGKCCPIPPKQRKQWACLEAKVPSASEKNTWTATCQTVDQKIVDEQVKYADLIRMDEVDVYRHLPQKLKFGYKWAIENTQAEWLVKTDDDSVVRVDTLEHYLTTTYNSSNPTVIGGIRKKSIVPKRGKWEEPEYKKSYYPNFPLGSFGHVVSRPVADYVVQHNDQLFNYQGEDVSLGIWLDESPLKDKVQWEKSKRTSNRGNCNDKNVVMIGHNIPVERMRSCLEYEYFHGRKYS